MPLDASVQFHWQDERRIDCYGLGKCIEVSESGMRVESTHPIAARTAVQMRLERFDFTTSAVIRHCVSRGRKYHLGLEFRGVDGRKLLEVARGLRVANAS